MDALRSAQDSRDAAVDDYERATKILRPLDDDKRNELIESTEKLKGEIKTRAEGVRRRRVATRKMNLKLEKLDSKHDEIKRERNYDEITENIRTLEDETKRLTIEALEKNEKTNQSMKDEAKQKACLLYTSPSPRDRLLSRMPSSA